MVGVCLVAAGLALATATAKATGDEKAAAPRAGARAAKQEGKIDQQAEAVLRHMSSYMARLKTLRVDTTTIDEKVTKDGLKVQELKESKLSMARPNKIAVDRTGPYGRVLFRYDGKQFAVYGASHNAYATAPAPPSLDAAIDEAGAPQFTLELRNFQADVAAVGSELRADPRRRTPSASRSARTRVRTCEEDP